MWGNHWSVSEKLETGSYYMFTVHEIIHKKLVYQKMSSSWVPKQLVGEHKFLLLGISSQLRKQFKGADGNFLEHVIM